MAYILVVDDDPDIVHAVVTVLLKEGYEVGAESDSESAIKSIRQRSPDLLLLDIMLPGDRTAGFELARRIRKERGDQQGIPIVMMSSINQIYPFHFSSDDINDEWMPVTEYIDKPIDFEMLKSKVAKLLHS